jgi:hypothetical protein
VDRHRVDADLGPEPNLFDADPDKDLDITPGHGQVTVGAESLCRSTSTCFLLSG